jgi:hypothetical protein
MTDGLLKMSRCSSKITPAGMECISGKEDISRLCRIGSKSYYNRIARVRVRPAIDSLRPLDRPPNTSRSSHRAVIGHQLASPFVRFSQMNCCFSTNDEDRNCDEIAGRWTVSVVVSGSSARATAVEPSRRIEAMMSLDLVNVSSLP